MKIPASLITALVKLAAEHGVKAFKGAFLHALKEIKLKEKAAEANAAPKESTTSAHG